MPIFLLHPYNQARIYSKVTVEAYTIGQETKFLGITLKGAPIFTPVLVYDGCMLANITNKIPVKSPDSYDHNAKTMMNHSVQTKHDQS